ncbi:MAG: IS607 family transposase, partial [Actinomycetota bacterium]|nr:IS607 family transposase [Actinomycetota bacterium]
MIVAVKLSEWAKANGVSRQSACCWFHAGVLPVPARQLATGTILVEEPPAGRAGVALYARVSSGDQRADLDCQMSRISMQATADGLASTKVVAEVGSGLNGHRTKLLSLLKDPEVTTIVVEHRDRLARFG